MPAGAPAALPYQVARTSQEFADDVLDAAPVPAGARAWYGRVPEALSEPPATGAQDRFHVYVVSDASASRLLQYVPAHLAGARYVGGASGGLPLEWEEFSLPVAGPRHSAALGYSLAAESGGYCPDAGLAGAPCLLRVDALTVWEPSRAAGEVVPVRDTVLLTAYSSVSLAGGPSSTYSVRLEWPQSTELVRQLDALPLGPGAGCMETAVAYRIVLKPATGPAQLRGRGANLRGRSRAKRRRARTSPPI